MRELTPDQLDAMANAADSDREFFELNPHRRYRVRSKRSGEPCEYVFVERISPGVRTRIGLDAPGMTMPPDLDDSECQKVLDLSGSSWGSIDIDRPPTGNRRARRAIKSNQRKTRRT